MLALIAERYRVSVLAARPWPFDVLIHRSSSSETVWRPFWP